MFVFYDYTYKFIIYIWLKKIYILFVILNDLNFIFYIFR